MPSVAVRIDADLQARLKKVAEADDRTPHYVMKKAIEAFVDAEELRLREIDILDERWAEYQRTGETIPAETVWAWVDSLPDGDDETDQHASPGQGKAADAAA